MSDLGRNLIEERKLNLKHAEKLILFLKGIKKYIGED